MSEDFTEPRRGIWINRLFLFFWKDERDKKSSCRSTYFLMGGLFVLVDLLAFLVVGPFEAAEAVAFENPRDPLNVAYFFFILLVFTIVILLIIC
jgi:hypothetical protein